MPDRASSIKVKSLGSEQRAVAGHHVPDIRAHPGVVMDRRVELGKRVHVFGSLPPRHAIAEVTYMINQFHNLPNKSTVEARKARRTNLSYPLRVNERPALPISETSIPISGTRTPLIRRWPFIGDGPHPGASRHPSPNSGGGDPRLESADPVDPGRLRLR